MNPEIEDLATSTSTSNGDSASVAPDASGQPGAHGRDGAENDTTKPPPCSAEPCKSEKEKEREANGVDGALKLEPAEAEADGEPDASVQKRQAKGELGKRADEEAIGRESQPCEAWPRHCASEQQQSRVLPSHQHQQQHQHPCQTQLTECPLVARTSRKLKPPRYIEKSVIIHRDENGFGLRVKGQLPVLVEHVHEQGAAWRAGVRKWDRISKVNGVPVCNMDHKDVVLLFKSCARFVGLTLLTCPPSLAGGGSSGELERAGAHSGAPTPAARWRQSMMRAHHGASLSLDGARRHRPDDSMVPDGENQERANRARMSELASAWLEDNRATLSRERECEREERRTSRESLPMEVEPQNGAPAKPGERHGDNDHDDHCSRCVFAGQSAQSGSSASRPRATCLSASQEELPRAAAGSHSCWLEACQRATLPACANGRERSRDDMDTGGRRSERDRRAHLGPEQPFGAREHALAAELAQAATAHLCQRHHKLSAPATATLCGRPLCVRSQCKVSATIPLARPPSGVSVGRAAPAQAEQPWASRRPCAHIPAPCSEAPKQTDVASKRLAIIKELVETERAHVERLRSLDELFYRPLKMGGFLSAEQLRAIFSCHRTLYKIHRQIYRTLLSTNYRAQPEPMIGAALLEIFDGELKRRLERAACAYCAAQSTNTELLNKITRRDSKTGDLLAQIASQQMIGRLGIKDLLASCFQRLTKYPLLLESLLKATPLPDSLEGPARDEDAAAAAAKGACCAGAVPAQLGAPPHRPLFLLRGSRAAGCASGRAARKLAGALKPAAGCPATLAEEDEEELTRELRAMAGGSTCGMDHEHAVYDVEDEDADADDDAADHVLDVDVDYAHCYEHYVASMDQIHAALHSSGLCKARQARRMQAISLAEERQFIERALSNSRDILVKVNEGIKMAISHNKLKDIWKRTDKYPGVPLIDISKQQVIHEGLLTLRLLKRSYDVYVLLLSDYIIILTREGQDKYRLKFFSPEGKSSGVVGHSAPAIYSPVFVIDEHLTTRDAATDENSFYLLCKRKDDSRIYEFASRSPAERIKWRDRIQLAIDRLMSKSVHERRPSSKLSIKLTLNSIMTTFKTISFNSRTDACVA